MRSVALLGSTGSIGRQAIQVCDDDPDLHVCALAAGSDADGVLREAERLGVRTIALADPAAAETARGRFSGRVLEGPAGVAQLAAESGADVVLNAVVGAAGLDATLAALEAGIDVALANKESLVAGGPLVREALARSGAPAAAGRLRALRAAPAAGGRGRRRGRGADRDRQRRAVPRPLGGRAGEGTPEQALRHPTWAMGARITIDSATLMNKGLEIIEAHWLFDVPYERIEVVVHPQSIVHGLVRLRDGALLAHWACPTCASRSPTRWPTRAARAVAAPRLDLTRALSLTFEPADTETFRCLALARAAGLAGGLAPCALNAADEEAVAAFLAARCRFADIPALVERALESAARASR